MQSTEGRLGLGLGLGLVKFRVRIRASLLVTLGGLPLVPTINQDHTTTVLATASGSHKNQ